MLVRNCENSDLKRIEEIENQSFDDPYPHSLFLRLLNNFPEGFRVAIENDSLIVGYCVLAKNAYDDKVMVLVSIAVDPAYKRKGIATSLLIDAISISRSIDNPKQERIILQVRKDNKDAISLYTRMGFQKSCIIPDYYGRGKDALEMQLLLSG